MRGAGVTPCDGRRFYSPALPAVARPRPPSVPRPRTEPPPPGSAAVPPRQGGTAPGGASAGPSGAERSGTERCGAGGMRGWMRGRMRGWALALLLGALRASGTELTFELPDSDKQCFHQELDRGLKFTLDYQVRPCPYPCPRPCPPVPAEPQAGQPSTAPLHPPLPPMPSRELFPDSSPAEPTSEPLRMCPRWPPSPVVGAVPLCILPVAPQPGPFPWWAVVARCPCCSGHGCARGTLWGSTDLPMVSGSQGSAGAAHISLCR